MRNFSPSGHNKFSHSHNKKWLSATASIFFVFSVSLAAHPVSAAEQGSEAITTTQPLSAEAQSSEAMPTTQSALAIEPDGKVAPDYGTLADVSGLFFQLPYLTTKLAIAITGGVIGGVTWIATGGDVTKATVVWDATLAGPWGWPDFVRGFGRAEEPGKPAGSPQR